MFNNIHDDFEKSVRNALLHIFFRNAKLYVSITAQTNDCI